MQRCRGAAGYDFCLTSLVENIAHKETNRTTFPANLNIESQIFSDAIRAPLRLPLIKQAQTHGALLSRRFSMRARLRLLTNSNPSPFLYANSEYATNAPLYSTNLFAPRSNNQFMINDSAPEGSLYYLFTIPISMITYFLRLKFETRRQVSRIDIPRSGSLQLRNKSNK